MLAVYHLLHCSVRTICFDSIGTFAFVNSCCVIQDNEFDVFAISNCLFAFILDEAVIADRMARFALAVIIFRTIRALSGSPAFCAATND